MALITRTSFSTGDIPTAAQWNTQFDTVYNEFNGSISNANISGSAAIAYSKLNLATSIVNADISASAAIAYSKLNLATSIVNADIGASAAIAQSKIDWTTDFSINTNKFTVNATSGNSLVAGTLTASGNLIASSDLYSVAWTDYGSTSTITGWAASPTANIWYKKLGSLVFVNFSISGTSNSTSSSFTLPYTSKNSTNAYVRGLGWGTDNGTDISGMAFGLNYNDNTVNIFKDATTTAWTNSGTKVCRGQFWYEAA